jgi:hypothetical protein
LSRYGDKLWSNVVERWHCILEAGYALERFTVEVFIIRCFVPIR